MEVGYPWCLGMAQYRTHFKYISQNSVPESLHFQLLQHPSKNQNPFFIRLFLRLMNKMNGSEELVAHLPYTLFNNCSDCLIYSGSAVRLKDSSFAASKNELK